MAPTAAELRELYDRLNGIATEMAAFIGEAKPVIKFVEQVQNGNCPWGKVTADELHEHKQQHAATRIKVIWAIIGPLIVAAVGWLATHIHL